MVHSIFSKCFAYCRYTGVTLVSWILLKSEYFHDGQLSCTVMKTSPPLPLMKKFSYASKQGCSGKKILGHTLRPGVQGAA